MLNTILEILCTSVDLVHGTLNDCSMKVGEPCDNVTCARGYEQNATFGSPTCTESGEWNHNLSTLCIGMPLFINLKVIFC